MMHQIEANKILNGIFSLEDPDEATKVLVAELNKIIEDIGPSKIVQVKNCFRSPQS